jgi:uncharacterized membrane protein
MFSASIWTLMSLAVEHDLLLRIEARPGRFVTERDAIFSAHPPERISDAIARRMRAAFVIGQERTPEQDLEFSIRRIVEIAQRALSPGTNDPTTALYCIDRLGEALGRLADRDIPAPMRFDEKRRLRIITEVASLDTLACPAFAAIARYGIADADIVRHLLSAMDVLQRAARPAESLELGKMIEGIRRESEDKLALKFDRQAVQGASKGGTPSRRLVEP